jgi:tRNA(His) 5'-end guanylyltransferase
MVRTSLPEEIAACEVLADRELQVGRPLVARLQGRRFEQLLDQSRYERPFDPGFGKAMVKTLSYLAATLGASFGYAERTEMSLFAVANGGDARRLISRIAGEGAAKMSLLTSEILTFDVHLYEFATTDLALEYFCWRQEDASLKAIDRYCTHVLGASGAEPTAVPRILEGMGPDEKVELLRQNALDFSQVPLWQRRGACIRLGAEGSNGNGATARLVVDLQPPADAKFGEYLRSTLTTPTTT